MEAIIAILVLVAFIASLVLVMRDIARSAADPEPIEEPEPQPMSVGTLSRRMDVPRKHPALRTRRSKTLP